PTAVASLQRWRNTAGSSSAPARKVSMIAPAPARNLIQGSSAPSTFAPSRRLKLPAPVPTRISASAVETRAESEQKLANSARQNQTAASVQTVVIIRLQGVQLRRAKKARLCGGAPRSVHSRSRHARHL